MGCYVEGRGSQVDMQAERLLNFLAELIWYLLVLPIFLVFDGRQ